MSSPCPQIRRKAPQASASAYSTTTACGLHFKAHTPQCMQRDSVMLNGLLMTPSIAPAGQFLLQSEQPMHLDWSICTRTIRLCPGEAICTPQGRSRNTVRNPCTFPRLWQSNICRPRAVPTPRRKDRCARRIRSQRIFPYRYDTPFSPPSHTSRHKPLEIFYHAARALSSSDFRPRTTPLHFILHSRF